MTRTTFFFACFLAAFSIPTAISADTKAGNDSVVVERLLAELTPEQTAAYRGILFNRKTARFFNEETLRTIETFLDADLNLSDTARQLYIHRNTLVYRLEKIKKLTGLDLREFDHAIIFKVALMVKKYLASRDNKLF